MHLLLLCVVAYLFGSLVFLMWEANPIITLFVVTIATGLAILEDFEQ